MNKITLSVLFVLTFVLLAPKQASAGGLFLTDRGVRALGRGGSFAAGADDPQSLWYNPAGLAYSKGQLLGDWTLSLFRANFQRVTRDDVNGPEPKVSADAMKLPIPTGAWSANFGFRNLTFGGGVTAPNALAMRWPDRVKGGTQAGPTRYSLLSMQGTLLADIAVGAAYSGIKGLSIGFSLHVIPVRFRTTAYLSACDYGALCMQPENPDWESPATVDLKFALTATPQFGLIYAHKKFRVGGTVTLFYKIKGDANLDPKLPSAPLFGPSDCGSNEARRGNPECAYLTGNKAHVAINMPMVARFGVELRPTRDLRVEVGAVYEGWGRQKDITLDPKNIRINNALSLPSYDVGSISIPRQMRDVWSLRLGLEQNADRAAIRMGVAMEKSAFPTKTLTPQTLDSDKVILSFGASYELLNDVFIDVMYAHIFMANVRVRDSIVYPQNPLRPPYEASPGDPVGKPEAVGNGNYAMEADMFGGGLRIKL